MRGNASYYQHKTLEEEKELRKLQRAKRKYQRILEDIDRTIAETELNLQRDLHCLSVQMADLACSNITD